MAIPYDTIAVDVDNGSASYQGTDVSCLDHGVLANAVLRGPSQPAKVSWRVRWGGPTGRFALNDSSNRFRLDAVETKATIDWSSDGPSGFRFKADPASSKAAYAIVGMERNGRFF